MDKYLAEILLGISIGAFITMLVILLSLIRKDLRSRFGSGSEFRKKKFSKMPKEKLNGH